MSDRTLTTLSDGGRFFEGPRWHDGRWWVSDFYRHAIYTVTTDGTETQVAEVPGQPSGLGWLPDGTLTGELLDDVLGSAGVATDPAGTVERVKRGRYLFEIDHGSHAVRVEALVKTGSSDA